MEKKMTTFAFGGGVRNVPSGRVCDDNDLSHEEGMLFVDGEHHVIRRPVEVGATTHDLVFVHDYSTYTHYVCMDNGNMYWADGIGESRTETPMGALGGVLRGVTAIGNTIVFSTSLGLKYWMWTGSEYKVIGELPELDVESELVDVNFAQTAGFKDIIWDTIDLVDYADKTKGIKGETEYNEALRVIIGHVTKCINKVKEKGGFPFAFWVRYGLRMYDDSVTMLTAPQLMLASVRANNYFPSYPTNVSFTGNGSYFSGVDGATDDWSNANYERIRYAIRASRLHFKIDTDLSDLSDLVRGVVVYVSDDVMPFYLEGTWQFAHGANGSIVSRNIIAWDKVCKGLTSSIPPVPTGEMVYTKRELGANDDHNMILPEKLTDGEIIKALIDRSQFYELCELPIDEIDANWRYADELMEHNALLHITARTQLPHDDFYDHTKLMAKVMLSYNGRLQLGDVTRSFFGGYKRFFPSYDAVREPVIIYVRIRTDEGERIARVDIDSTSEYLGYWFYYPDPRAFEVIYFYNGSAVSYPLKEHPYLNGAYMFRCLPTSTSDSLNGGATTTRPSSNVTPENLPSYVVTSEVNNPYFFPVDGWNRIGSGVIRALGATTDALSEGQFGQFPLMAFTSEGVWAMSLTKEGLYDDIHPISREVITEEGIVVQTDDTLFFLCERGLAVVVGRKVKLVSESLRGKMDDVSSFGVSAPGVSEFLKYPNTQSGQNTRGMVYDYPNSLLWIWKEDSDYALVYSIKSGAFAMSALPARWESSHILYPDVLVQQADGKILSFVGEGDVNEDDREYDGVLLSRPMKMKDILHEKRVLEMMHHMDLSGGTFAVSMWGSNDLSDWREVTELGGMGWKYWRLKLEFTDMGATAVYSGTTLVHAIERAHRLREEG